jgi:hypothetical protein
MNPEQEVRDLVSKKYNFRYGQLSHLSDETRHEETMQQLRQNIENFELHQRRISLNSMNNLRGNANMDRWPVPRYNSQTVEDIIQTLLAFDEANRNAYGEYLNYGQ